MADQKISQLTSATTPLVGTEVLPIVQSGTTKKVSIDNVTAGRTVSAANFVLSGDAAIGTSITTGLKLSIRAAQTGTAIGCDNGVNTGFVVKFAPGLTNIGNDFSQPLGFLVNDVQQAKVEASGNLTLNTGNLVLGTAGRGINFSANTHAAGMTSELLNWYEEGTWTPTLQGGSTAGSYTVATTTAQYTRVGRMVTVTAGMAITVNSAGTGVARFGGLPFTKGANQFLNGSVSTSAVSYGANVISVNVQAWTSGASTDFALLGVRSGTAPYDVAITDFVTGSVVYVTFTYFV